MPSRVRRGRPISALRSDDAPLVPSAVSTPHAHLGLFNFQVRCARAGGSIVAAKCPARRNQRPWSSSLSADPVPGSSFSLPARPGSGPHFSPPAHPDSSSSSLRSTTFDSPTYDRERRKRRYLFSARPRHRPCRPKRARTAVAAQAITAIPPRIVVHESFSCRSTAAQQMLITG
jgi:hypothetical protein